MITHKNKPAQPVIIIKLRTIVCISFRHNTDQWLIRI